MTNTIIFVLVCAYALYTVIKSPGFLVLGVILAGVGLYYGNLNAALIGFVILTAIFGWANGYTPNKAQEEEHRKSVKEQQLAQLRLQERRNQEKDFERNRRYHNGQ